VGDPDDPEELGLNSEQSAFSNHPIDKTAGTSPLPLGMRRNSGL